MSQLTQEASAAASVVSLLLAQTDLDYEGLCRLVTEHRRLNRLLEQIMPDPDDLLPQAGPRLFSTTLRVLPPAGHIKASGTTCYCRGCGYSFDSSRPLEAAQHRSH